MAKAPAFQFYPKDYESDEHVKMMSLEQEGAFLRLLCHAWLHGSVPAEVQALARICRVPPAKMARLWPGVAVCFEEIEPGRLANLRQERGRIEQERFRKERSDSGRRGADKQRKMRTAEPQNGNGSATAEPSLSHGLRTAVSVLPSPENVGTYVPAPDVRAENAIRAKRAMNERKLLRAVALIAEKTGDEATDVMRKATAYKAANDGRLVTGRVNPALLSEERLEKSLEDAEAWLALLEVTP